MPVPKKLPKSPFEIMKPEYRWTPDISASDKEFSHYNAPLVEKIRKQLFDWRSFGYDGISDTSKSLLNYWFNESHSNNFRYFFAQRESVESVIYLYEYEKIRYSKELFKFDSWGTLSESSIEDDWLRLVLKQATGTGKTKVLTLIMVWSYFCKNNEIDSELSKNFLLIAPNTIVLDRLRSDIEGLRVFNDDPLIPYNNYDGKEWNFNPTVHIQDDIKPISKSGNIFLTNIQRFANRDEKTKSDNLMNQFLGPTPVKETTSNKLKVKDIIKDLDDLIILNDEAHHIHEENAWKKTIADIDNNFIQKGKKLLLQVDVTATPKNKKGQIFFQTISDYPIVEAIHQNVVKKPVLPDQPSRDKLKELKSTIFSERYREYIDLGVQTWEKQFEKHKKMGRKALLFVMIDYTKNCDDVADYLKNTYPSLKGDATFVIHSQDNSKTSTGEIKENTSKGQKELKRLRRLINTVDDMSSPVKAIVSVLMLKEGWDVKNVTTIVGLRAYESYILPEQTLGRGLRRMYFDSDIDEELDVIGTDNFIDFVKSISKEGVELEERPAGGPAPPSGPIVIEIDKNKDLELLDIDIPDVNKRLQRDFLSLDSLDINKIDFKVQSLKKYSDDEMTKEIVFREILEEQEVKTISFKSMQSIDSTKVIGFYTDTVLKQLRLLNVGIGHFVYEKIKDFVKDRLFGKTVDLDEINVIKNLSEPVITELIIQTFKKEINTLTIKDMGFKDASSYHSIANTKPYLSSRKKLYYASKKSVFNLIAGDSKFEIEFAQFLDGANDVVSFFKNDIQLAQSIPYVKHDGSIGSYHPDFFVKLNNGDRWVVETKGAESLNDQRKLERLKIWCEDATKAQGLNWGQLYIRQELWNASETPNSFDDSIKLFS